MRTISLIGFTLSAVLLVVIAANGRSADRRATDEIISVERAALDRWGKGDPKGFLQIYAPEITYFDPGIDRRIDGRAAMSNYYLPFTGKIKIARYEIVGPKVQRHGDVAVLAYNLRSEAIQPDGKQATIRWNSTSVYALINREWKVIHSHWSLTTLPCAKGIM